MFTVHSSTRVLGILLLIVLGVGIATLAIGRKGWLSTSDVLEQGASAYEKGDWQAAATHARERLKVAREDPASVRLLARASARLGRDPSAQKLFGLLAPKDRMAEDEFLLGLILGRMNQIEAAKSAWEAVLANYPNHAETLESLSQLYAREHRLDRAIELSERLSLEKGWESRGLRLLGVLRGELNDTEGSAVALLGSLEKRDAGETVAPPESAIRKLTARQLLRLGRPTEARKQLQPVIGATPDMEASWLLSRAALQEGKITQANESLAVAGSYRADHPLIPDPGPYVGEARCTRCHQAIARDMAETRHTTTIHHGDALKKLATLEKPMTDPGEPKIVHSMTQNEGALVFQSKIDEKIYRLVIDYAFGTNDRYVTMVGRDEQGMPRAARLSFHRYPHDTGWDVSAGDTTHHKAIQDYLGKPVGEAYGVIKCVDCHATNTRFGKVRTGPETLDRGIGCERCHGPGANHIAAIEAGMTDLAIVNPAHAPDSARDNACSSCHNLNAATFELTTPREDPAWVRSPGKTITWSRCYTESAGALRCLTCHEAHRPSKTAPSFYEQKCRSCHSDEIKLTNNDSANLTENRKCCPINAKSDCLNCHMPKVQNALLHTGLTDHYIRVRKESVSTAVK